VKDKRRKSLNVDPGKRRDLSDIAGSWRADETVEAAFAAQHNLKEMLAAMPDVGDDEDFKRMQDCGQSFEWV
jgi:predicted ATPase with chaperone activity